LRSLRHKQKHTIGVSTHAGLINFNKQTRGNKMIPTQQQYEQAEASRLYKELQAVEQDSLINRKDAKREFSRLLQHDLSHIFKCLEYLCNGDYGFGSIHRIKKMTKRMNRRAGVFILLAAIEYKVPCKMACEVWKNLDTDLQAAINAKIDEQLNIIDEVK
jgi:hypothetical protein